MSIHITVTRDAGTVHYRRTGGMWVMTDLSGWDVVVSVESTIHQLNAVSMIGFGELDPDQLTLDGVDNARLSHPSSKMTRWELP